MFNWGPPPPGGGEQLAPANCEAHPGFDGWGMWRLNFCLQQNSENMDLNQIITVELTEERCPRNACREEGWVWSLKLAADGIRSAYTTFQWNSLKKTRKFSLKTNWNAWFDSLRIRALMNTLLLSLFGPTGTWRAFDWSPRIRGLPDGLWRAFFEQTTVVWR